MYRHTSECTVRIEQANQKCKSCDKGNDSGAEYRPAKYVGCFFVFKLFLFGQRTSESVSNILKNAKRTNGRTVHSAKNKCENDQSAQHHKIQRQQCRQKLYFGKETETLWQNAGEVDKIQSNQRKKNHRHCNTDFSEHDIRVLFFLLSAIRGSWCQVSNPHLSINVQPIRVAFRVPD